MNSAFLGEHGAREVELQPSGPRFFRTAPPTRAAGGVALHRPIALDLAFEAVAPIDCRLDPARACATTRSAATIWLVQLADLRLHRLQPGVAAGHRDVLICKTNTRQDPVHPPPCGLMIP